MKYNRAWDGKDWQAFALQLVQLRHGAQNVQRVPDLTQGDAGIEFFTMDGCMYQCYAPQETSDTGKAASAMKSKATNDLNKVKRYKDKIEELLKSIQINRWILLCPFLDDKAVVSHVRGKGADLKNEGLSFLQEEFEALVQCQEDFATEYEILRQQSLTIVQTVDKPTEEEVAEKSDSELALSLKAKLHRAFPAATEKEILEKINKYLKVYIIRENTLQELQINKPFLWERTSECLSSEEERLAVIGHQSVLPVEQLGESVNRLEKSIRNDLQDLATSTITNISLGTVADWLIRCPLDFPEG